MRLWTVVILIGALGAPLAACNRHDEQSSGQSAATRKAVETPKRKPGLWTQTTNVEGLGSIPAVRICLDAAADQKIAWWGQQGARAGCVKNEVNHNADGSWSFSSLCQTVGGIRTSTTGSASGDFQDSYEVRATSTTEGSPMPEMNGSHSVVIEAKWEGPCPADMKPGDMKLPDGSVVNMTAVTPAPTGAP